jgi:hypothetical protein
MNTFSRKGRIGLLAIFTVLLTPLLGIGNASAIELNDKVSVVVPDLQEFPESGTVKHMFTCRAITDHAVWLVQDTSFVDNHGGFNDTTFVPKLVWGADVALNLVDPAEFAALTTSFENNVWGKVTGICGVPKDINNDGKVVVILASIPTKYNAGPSSQVPRNDMYYTNSSLNKIAGEAMEVFYLNIHSFTRSNLLRQDAIQMREWNLSNGLGALCITSTQSTEKSWLVRGLAEVMQFKCFGMTKSEHAHGLYEAVSSFGLADYIELTNPASGSQTNCYSASRGQEFLWFMYLAQRKGDSIISTLAKDTVKTGMLSVALAVNPQGTDSTVIQKDLVPLYYDWLVCNLHNDFRSDFAGGIYKYDFLAGTELANWAHAGVSAAFTLSFSKYPIAGKVSGRLSGMAGPIWASQYIRFESFTQNWETYFNGQYSNGSGGNGATNSRWEGQLVKCNETSGEYLSVETVSFDSFYNATFTLGGTATYLIVTNNNPGGAAGMRYYVSNDTVLPQMEYAIHPNAISTQYLKTYCALVDTDSLELEGFDWVGPIFQATLGDSTLNIKMKPLYGDLWTGVFPAWSAGKYKISFSGYDSTGHHIETLKDVVVGFADSGTDLELEYARLHVPAGGAPGGSMITLAETGAIDFTIESALSIRGARGRMTGIVAGPVAISDVNGTISFTSGSNAAAVYRYTNNGWVMLSSWMQAGYITAAVEEGGVYALGEGIGVSSPEIPAQLVLSGNAPNPFSAQTAISFGLPVSGNVVLNVFDMTGRLVTTVANGEMAAANHTIVWDGTDSTGSQVGAGVYFCRLETAGQVLTQKMLKVQ